MDTIQKVKYRKSVQIFQNVCVQNVIEAVCAKKLSNYAFSTTGAWSSELLLLVAMIPQELSSIRVAGVSVPNGISC